MMNNLFTKREFIRALIASVITVGVPLPIGFLKKEVSVNLTWAASGPGTINLKYWHIYEAFKEGSADLDMDTIVIQLNAQKLLTHDA